MVTRYFAWMFGVVFLCRSVIGQTNTCNVGWFGADCKYQCHCKFRVDCDVDGDCGDAPCADGWFGPQCQYKDLAYNVSPKLTDGDDSTCATNSYLPRDIYFPTNFTFTWLRMVAQKPGVFDKVNITFRNSAFDIIPVPVAKPLVFLLVNDIVMDVHGQLKEDVRIITLTGEGVTSLCSFHVSGGRNVALKQSATQSSDQFSGFDSYKGQASNAVDGDTNGNFDVHTCTQTMAGSSANWTVDIFRPVQVERYLLYNRDSWLCRLSYFRLTSRAENTSIVQEYQDRQGRSRDKYAVLADGKTPVTSVTVSIDKTFWLPYGTTRFCSGETSLTLTLCEVQVYGDVICDHGQWGRECELNCTNCAVPSEPCYVSTGICPSGCKAGYHGEGCREPCETGRWGQDCRYTCSEFCAKGLCNSNTGECEQGCLAGFQPPNCDKVCEDGFHGVNCSQTCPISCKGGVCNNVNGTCTGCQIGYQGDTCDIFCDEGFWGADCRERCSVHCASGTCHPMTGACDGGCNMGYRLPICVDGCATGFHGYNCSKRCPSDCKNLECDSITGLCLACQEGHQGAYCDEECKPGLYGDGCAFHCSEVCVGGTCDHHSGACDVCPEGKQGNLCDQDCKTGRYGRNCERRCSVHCKGSGECDPMNGICKDGCQPGYQGDRCDEECSEKSFGENCDEVCSENCADEMTSETDEPITTICNHVTGQCMMGCVRGYKGETCEELIEDSDPIVSTGIVVGAVCGLVGILIILAVVIVLLIRYRRKPKPDEEIEPGDGEIAQSAVNMTYQGPRQSLTEAMFHSPQETPAASAT